MDLYSPFKHSRLELTLFRFYLYFSPLAPKLPPNAELCHVTDSLRVGKSTNHLRNNSFYEFVPLVESMPWSLGWASQSATA